MKKCCRAIGAGVILAVGVIGWPGTAAAASRSTDSAADVVSDLQAQGYDVQLNGQHNGALAQCTVTGLHRSAPTVYVDLDCPGDD